jgi:hypothetical protein
MNHPQEDPRFDALAAQLQDWTDDAVALDEGHFPNELLSDLDDLIGEMKEFLDDAGADYGRRDVIDLFITPEMMEVVERFARVRRYLEQAWGSQLIERIEEESSGFEMLDEDDD